jgi:hypothetical protein
MKTGIDQIFLRTKNLENLEQKKTIWNETVDAVLQHTKTTGLSDKKLF